MKYRRVSHILVLGIIISSVAAFAAIPAYASGENIDISPREGEIGDKIEIDGRGFEVNTTYRIYFSSDEAKDGDDIDTEVTAYESSGIKWTNAEGRFNATFTIPSKLTDGEDSEDVHGGIYYFYVTYHHDTVILDSSRFTVIGGKIEIYPESGQVGTRVEINGEKFGISQKITAKYDDNSIDIASGDTKTNEEGEFTCAIIIPESTLDTHAITVTDKAGNEPEAEFSVKPKITIAPTSGAAGETIKVSGTGFKSRDYLTITFDESIISTTPPSPNTRANGSFICSFIVPANVVWGTSKIRASDDFNNWAEAELVILSSVSLNPATSQDSPGHVGMELTVNGTGFSSETLITISYDESKVATATTDNKGKFSATFPTPSGAAGNHIITITYGTDTITHTFTMESEAPPIPVPLIPEVATTADVETHFDWKDVADPSGITYTLQIGTDADFITKVLQKEGLTKSEYTLTKAEMLESSGMHAPYYWRVRAIDNAFNEGKWTIPMLFYTGHAQEIKLDWTLYLWIGLGALLFGIFVFWTIRRIRR